MAERTLPGLGLTGFWDLGQSGWKDGMDANLRVLSVLARQWAKSRVTSLPAPGTLGDVYLVPSGAGEHANKIAVWDGASGAEAWVYLLPLKGMVFRVDDEGARYEWNGAAWSASGGGAAGLVVESITGTTYVQIAADKSKWKRTTNASPVAITIAANVNAATDEITFSQGGAGQITFAAGGGMTLNPRGGTALKSAGQFAVCGVKFFSATEATLFGDITA